MKKAPPKRKRTNLLREIPAVNELLQRPAIADLCAQAGREYATERVREVLAEVRAGIASAPDESAARELLAGLESRVVRAVHAGLAPSLRPVINATGVILHTNLGRAPLSKAAAQAVLEAARGYTNLEYDLETGRRGKRDVHAARLLSQLLGAPAVVVNNNAAAVFLVLHTLAAGGEVIVSRGELVEIGGSFRIPDIMAASAAVLREVGTTNRTRLADYEKAINKRTRLLLAVHRSNFKIVGFTERPALADLAALAKRAKLPLVEDLGSGCLFDLRPYGITDEPLVQESLKAGVDLVTFSGDKLLGGPQAGIIAGRPEMVERIRKSPLFRALRVDKMTYAALGATLRSYLSGRLEELPVARMIRMSREEVARRAEVFVTACAGLAAHGWRFELAAGESVIGGGSTPGQALPTTLVAVRHPRSSAGDLEHRLRSANPPVLARVENNRVLIDLRTVFPEQEPVLLTVLQSLSQ
jgi:L-seryl-tRNA(Ser) seleniumtransferase